ncbi:hypothetical protein Pf1_00281 [Flavobacterium columnare]|nr:hypothetical protein Pf1_00281 [Flavobacterium columnare]
MILFLRWESPYFEGYLQPHTHTRWESPYFEGGTSVKK